MDNRRLLRGSLLVAKAIAADDPSWPRQLVRMLTATVGADTVGFGSWQRENFLDSRSESTGGPPLRDWERELRPLFLDSYPFFRQLFAHGNVADMRTSDHVDSILDFRHSEVYGDVLAPRKTWFQANIALIDGMQSVIVGIYRHSHDFGADEIEALERARQPLAAALRYRLAAASIESTLGSDLPPHPGDLTPREQGVLALVATGATNGQIASRLGITERTVRKHVQNIHARLEVTNRVAATRWWADHLNRAEWSDGAQDAGTIDGGARPPTTPHPRGAKSS